MLYWPATIFRTLIALLATLLGWGMMLVCKILERPFPRVARAVRNRAFRAWAKVLLRAFRVRVETHGCPPPPGTFLVSNHVSYLDIMVIGSEFDASFVAKADIRGWPLLGLIFAAADTLYLDRGRKRDLLRVMTAMDEKLEKGLGLVVFPEGTSTRGEDILPLRPSLLQYAVEREIPVYSATLVYRTAEGELAPSRGVCWWGNEELLPHFKRMMSLSRIDVRLHFSEKPCAATDRKILATDLRETMLESFTPMP